MESGRVRRTTLFKVPEPEKQAKLVEAFRVLADTQEKACHCSSPPTRPCKTKKIHTRCLPDGPETMNLTRFFWFSSFLALWQDGKRYIVEYVVRTLSSPPYPSLCPVLLHSFVHM